jgi:hypothetical protein
LLPQRRVLEHSNALGTPQLLLGLVCQNFHARADASPRGCKLELPSTVRKQKRRKVPNICALIFALATHMATENKLVQRVVFSVTEGDAFALWTDDSWNNTSSFALLLGEALRRQAIVFVEGYDHAIVLGQALHSPHANALDFNAIRVQIQILQDRATMKPVVNERCAPAEDVDCHWHTSLFSSFNAWLFNAGSLAGMFSRWGRRQRFRKRCVAICHSKSRVNFAGLWSFSSILRL